MDVDDNYSALPFDVVVDHILEFYRFPVQRYFYVLDFTLENPMQCQAMIKLLYGCKTLYREPRLLFKHLDCKCMHFENVNTNDLRTKHGRQLGFCELKSINLELGERTLESFISRNPNVESISFTITDMNETLRLLPLLKKIPKIHKLTISDLAMQSDDIIQLAELNNVRRYNTVATWNNNGELPIKLLGSFAKLGTLTRCNLSFSGITDNRLEVFLNNESITSLDLIGNQIGVSGIQTLVTMKRLKRLAIRLNDTTCRALSCSTTLKTLVLDNQSSKTHILSAEGLQTLCSIPTLEEIESLWGSIDDKIIQEWCTHKYKLRKLEMKLCRLGSNGLKAIIDSMPQLTTLIISSNNKIRLPGLEALQYLPNLIHLDIMDSAHHCGDLQSTYDTMLGALTKLKYLSIDYYPCDRFFFLSDTHTSLETLKLSAEDAEFDQDIIKTILENPYLKSLMLANSDRMKNSYLRSIKKNTTLQSLEIFSCYLIGEDLFKYLIKNKSLTSLKLENCTISNSYSLKPFVEMCKNITYLDIICEEETEF
jgi:hypothetical protein